MIFNIVLLIMEGIALIFCCIYTLDSRYKKKVTDRIELKIAWNRAFWGWLLVSWYILIDAIMRFLKLLGA